jgi:GNAT superfamily N-acetyltransferase
MDTPKPIFTIERTTPDQPDCAALIEALSAYLGASYGRDGKASFGGWDKTDPRAIFVLARRGGAPAGCGALRPLDAATGEIKRMYAVPGCKGAGSAVLLCLEGEARALEYQTLKLETLKANSSAIAFYLRHGYQVCDNFGQYIGRDECICFEKAL